MEKWTFSIKAYELVTAIWYKPSSRIIIGFPLWPMTYIDRYGFNMWKILKSKEKVIGYSYDTSTTIAPVGLS